MFRLAFVVAILLLLGLQSFFTGTTHEVAGQHHVFRYSWVAGAFLVGFVGIVATFAWIAWQPLKDKILGGILFASLPVLVLLLAPQLWCERVELTDQLLIHRREWPHDQFNADLAWDDIVAAEQVNREDNSFGKTYIVGYEIHTRDGSVYKLPSNTVLTAASPTIDAELKARRIPTPPIVRRR